jgi:hypothetical protein
MSERASGKVRVRSIGKTAFDLLPAPAPGAFNRQPFLAPPGISRSRTRLSAFYLRKGREIVKRLRLNPRLPLSLFCDLFLSAGYLNSRAASCINYYYYYYYYHHYYDLQKGEEFAGSSDVGLTLVAGLSSRSFT